MKKSFIFLLICLFWNISHAVTTISRQASNFTNLSGYAWSTTTTKLGLVAYSRGSTTYPIDVLPVTTSTSVSTTYNLVNAVYFSSASVQSVNTAYKNPDIVRWTMSSTETINKDSRMKSFNLSAPFQPIDFLTTRILFGRITTTYNPDSSYLYFGFTVPPCDTSVRIIMSQVTALPFGTFCYRSSANWIPSAKTYTLSSATSVLVFTDFNAWSPDTIDGSGTGYYWVQFTMSSTTTAPEVFASIQSNSVTTTDTINQDTAYRKMNPKTPLSSTSLTIPSPKLFLWVQYHSIGHGDSIHSLHSE